MKARYIVAPVVALALVGLGWAGLNYAKADDNNTNSSTLVDKIVEKFNLNKDEVESVVGELHTQRQQERQAMQDSKLDTAVSDGVITEGQKKELIEKRNSFREQQEQVRQAHRDEMSKWMSDNGIDSTKLQSYMGGGNGKGKFRGE